MSYVFRSRFVSGVFRPMSNRGILFGVALVLVLALGIAWKAFSLPDQPAAAPDARSPDGSLETQSKAGASPTLASESVSAPGADPIAPGSSAASEEPAEGEAVPLDLTDHYSMKASNFDRVTQFPWPAAPRGRQKFANVPLEIGGAMFLWGERNAQRGQAFPEQIADIAVGRKFETLYVCHGLFFEGQAGTLVYEAVLHYDDGTTATDAIVCGDDVRDWFSNGVPPLGPSGARSTLAWEGEGKYGDRDQAIRFCLTAIANPHPDKDVTAIDFVSLKSQSAA